MKNHESIGKGFALLNETLARYVASSVKASYPTGDWREEIRKVTRKDWRKETKEPEDDDAFVATFDLARCLELLDAFWQPVFRRLRSRDFRNWAKELQGTRNKWAHVGTEDFSDGDAMRALDTTARLCEEIDPERAEEIRKLYRDLLYKTTGAGAASNEADNDATSPNQSAPTRTLFDATSQASPSGLPSWRDVVKPHPDVANGNYKKAEFAADLAQVAAGQGAYEYRDPVEFFARTYVTVGMRKLLEQTLRRVAFGDGDPVVQLKTAFGGGKTHSMLALYHLLRGAVTIDKIPNVKPALDALGLAAIPKVRVAVVVGTALEPAKSKRPPELPGITINTVWGEIAAQLAKAAGDLKLYDIIRDSDKKGVSPGSRTLKELFDACGPCLILMDELVPYARKLAGGKDLPAGTYGNFISFTQEIAEAARASEKSVVVASIPESETEIGGEDGLGALRAIEKTFGRMEAIWRPVEANEGFEIVRRRLFLDCVDETAKEKVCAAFGRMYVENDGAFPTETKELEYLKRLRNCYPIHPEFFDRLYNDWATLEKFQKTRGVLRLTAAVVHRLWMSADAGALVMPSSLPLEVPNVRDELTQYLDEPWNAIVDTQVDGKKSTPYKLDAKNPRFGGSAACRRVARAIFLGSAPSAREQKLRGVDITMIRLGVAQPGENLSTFNDALNELEGAEEYLYADANRSRFWFDSRPTLRKTASERELQVDAIDVADEIGKRLRKTKAEAPFVGVHVCPASTLDVPDEQRLRLVVLPPDCGFKKGATEAEDCEALRRATETLEQRGDSARRFKNTLAFLAPDVNAVETLKTNVRKYLAWVGIEKDADVLNLDAAQKKEAENNVKSCDRAVDLALRDAYCWTFAPSVERNALTTIEWDVVRLTDQKTAFAANVAKSMREDETLIGEWAARNLRSELDALLWNGAEFLSVERLWGQFCSYCYLPRLASFAVLQHTIRQGVRDGLFALADAFDGERFVGLTLEIEGASVGPERLLVSVDAARAQLEREKRKEASRTEGDDVSVVLTGVRDVVGKGASGVSGSGTTSPTLSPVLPPTPEPKKSRSFWASIPIDAGRVNRDVGTFTEFVLPLLKNVPGARARLALEIVVEFENGCDAEKVDAVSKLCDEMRYREFGFED